MLSRKYGDLSITQGRGGGRVRTTQGRGGGHVSTTQGRGGNSTIFKGTFNFF